VYGCNLVPRPPARIIAFIYSHLFSMMVVLVS
jgi:hypothetical protein